MQWQQEQPKQQQQGVQLKYAQLNAKNMRNIKSPDDIW